MPFAKVDKTESEVNLEKENIEFSLDHVRFKILMRNPRSDVKRTVDYSSLQLKEEI